MAKLFVAFSHSLTPSQKEGWDSIITLGEIEPGLQEHMSQIPAKESLDNIKLLASLIVAEAVKAEATHFFCVGEPTLTWWANYYAGFQEGKDPLICVQSTTERKSSEIVNPDGNVRKVQIFQHVQWREMF